MDTKYKYRRIAIFAGTSEGHDLAKQLKELGMLDNADFYVATEYGKTTYDDFEDINLFVGRLNQMEMEKLFTEKNYALVIDATHPYAQVVTSFLKAASNKVKVTYLRFSRAEVEFDRNLVEYAKDQYDAGKILNKSEEKFLLTTGAKEVSAYKNVRDLENRGVARVLPTVESIESCLKAGILQKHIICMQGPFSHEMNIATMEQFGCKILVTKITGRAGGFKEKVALATEGYKVIVIGKPDGEEISNGLAMTDILERLKKLWML